MKMHSIWIGILLTGVSITGTGNAQEIPEYQPVELKDFALVSFTECGSEPCVELDYDKCLGSNFWDSCDSKCYGTCRDMTPNMIGESMTVPLVLRAGGGEPVLLFPRTWLKPSDNNSPLPRTRVSYTYNYYHNVLNSQDPGGRDDYFDLSQHKFLLEKAFMDDRFSLEFILPFAQTLDSQQLNTDQGGTQLEMGNIGFGAKLLLFKNDKAAISTGVRVEAPTSEDLRFQLGGGGPRRLDMDDWYFTPYAAALYKPTDRLFFQGFGGYRMDTGNIGYYNQNSGALQRVYQQPDILFLDASVGYWMHRSQTGFVRGIVPTLELHYQGTFESAFVQGSGTATNQLLNDNSTSQLTMTAGVTTLVNDNTSLALAAAVPLRHSAGVLDPSGRQRKSDEFFEWELMLQLNVYLGQ